MFALLAVAAARAGWDPGLEPADVADQYRAFAVSKGRKGEATELVCRPFAEATVLCYSRDDGKKRVYATRAAGVDAGALEAQSRGTDAEALACLVPVVPEGTTRSYLACTRGDGRDHVPLLHPDALAARVGKTFVAAAPARGVLVVWTPGDAEFDKLMAVGVRRMFEGMPDPVSPLVYRWDGGHWVTWGQARELPDPVGTPDG